MSMAIECGTCGGVYDQRACNGCGRILTSAELMRALPPLDPSVRYVEQDKVDFAEREA